MAARLRFFEPGLETQLRALGLSDLCELRGDLAEPRLAELAEPPVPRTRARTRRLYCLAGPRPGAPRLFVKLQLARARDLPLAKWASYTLQPSPLVREARAAAALGRLGLRTPDVLASGSHGRFPASVRAVLITREVPDHGDLETLLEGGLQPDLARRSIHALEALVASLHARGLALGGARYRDFLVPETGAEGPEDVLIIDAASFGRGAKRRARDRSQLELDRARWF